MALYAPDEVKTEKLPLVISTGGAEELSRDIARTGGMLLLQAENACYAELEKAVSSVLSGYGADANRVYAVGDTAWSLIVRYPELFAAAVSTSDEGDPYSLDRVRHIPVWEACPGERLMVRAHRGWGAQSVGSDAPEPWELADWLAKSNRGNADKVTLLKPGVWYMNDCTGASWYMVEGAGKALVIDTGMGPHPIMPQIRALTDKPVELAVTHAHGDHMMHMDEFDTVYMAEGERQVLPMLAKLMMPGREPDVSNVRWLREGDVIELGGVSVETAIIGGHTPGSAAFIDHGHKCIFSGDAFGSGIFSFMSVPGALTLGEYRRELLRFASKLGKLPDYIIYGGHREQERGTFDLGPTTVPSEQPRTYNPPRLRMVLDMAELCAKLISGEIKGEPCPPGLDRGGEEPRMATYGSATIMYLESRAV